MNEVGHFYGKEMGDLINRIFFIDIYGYLAQNVTKGDGCNANNQHMKLFILYYNYFMYCKIKTELFN